MKSFPKPTTKWILSTVMMLALGSQYYYRTSSNEVYTIEMSSSAAPKPIIWTVTVAEKDKDKSETEARTVTLGCDNCGDTTTMTGTQAEIHTKIQQLSGIAHTAAARTTTVTVAAPAAAQTAGEEKAETYEEKKAACNKEKNYKERKECLKIVEDEKKEEEQEARAAVFDEAVTKMAEKCQIKADKCSDKGNCDGTAVRLSCTTEEFKKLLRKFKGKNRVDTSLVKTAFGEHIEKDLRGVFTSVQSDEQRLLTLMNSGNASQSQIAELENRIVSRKDLVKDLVGDLSSNIPSSYNSVTTKTVDVIESVLTANAAQVNSNYKLHDQLTKANKPADALRAGAQAQIGHQAVVNSANLYKQVLETQILDPDAKAYYEANYVPDITRILTNIQSLTGTGILTQPTTNGSSRDARNGTTTATSTGTTTNTGNGVTWGIAGGTSTGTRVGTQSK